jgi:hypothetical protein
MHHQHASTSPCIINIITNTINNTDATHLATHATMVFTMASNPKLAAPRAANPTATRPPTMLWVAEMGRPYTVASRVVDPAPEPSNRKEKAGGKRTKG